MYIEKQQFIQTLSRMERQYQLDLQNHAGHDNSNLWIAAIELLSLAIGTEDALSIIYAWIYDCEFGRYPDERLSVNNSEELWEFLAIKQEK